MEEEQEPPPLPSAPQQEIPGSAFAPPPSQGTGQETVGTGVSATQTQTQTQLNRFDPLNLAPAQEETITRNTSVPAAEFRQPPVDPGTVGIEEGGDSNHVLDPKDIIVDPTLLKPIEEMHPNIRDTKREYVLICPCQPIGHKYPVRKIYGRNRRFHDKWYTDRPWLEYSISKDAAFCFYCYLFKPLRVDNYGVKAFTTNGFVKWKDGPKLFDDHAFTTNWKDGSSY